MRGILTLLAFAGLATLADAQISRTATANPAAKLPVIAKTTSGRSTTIILDISGAQSWDATGDLSNQWFYVPIPVGDVMTGIGWDVNLTTVGASFLSDSRFYFDGSDQDGYGLWLTPGVADAFSGSGTYSSGGVLDLTDNGIPDIAILADGLLWIELNEVFDDVADAVDADWTATSTLTIIHETPVPPPPAIWLEDFDSGTWPPAGWTVVDNVGNGNTWQTSSYFLHGNLTTGTGECAAVDDDYYGSGTLVDTELISPPVDIPAGTYDLWFANYYDALGDAAMVDLSVGGGPWTNLKTWSVDAIGTAMLSLHDWGGTNGIQFRFHYDDLGSWAWYWHVDDVAVRPGTPPPVAIWEEDFDGGTFPPAGWTVIDNAGNGNVWALTSNWMKGNQSGGSGEAAAIDDDEVGSGVRTDTELLTPSFNVPSAGLDFMYIHNFYDQYVAEQGYTDISVGGGPWTNLETYAAANTGTKSFDMDSYAGANVQIRFHYDDFNSWGWFWHVDDVGLFQPVSSGPGTPYCFGNTASGNPCPCANDNDGTDPLGAGCAHDDSAAGARLGASGVASVSADTLLFEGFNGPVSNSSLFFQANNNQDGNGLFLGDGIRCAGGGLIRLKVKLTDASGYADSSPMVVTTRSASFGHTITAGETLYYQWWFRDANGSPCGAESNTSNGYMITWAP